MENPYQPPQQDAPGSALAAEGPGVCPNCRSGDYTKVGFTWWGGLLGPKLFNHVKCQGCGTTFNSKTGKSNNTGITIYFVVTSLLAVGVVVGMNMN
jgi:transposase-like protein